MTPTISPQQLAECVEYLRQNGLSGGSEKRRSTRMQVQARILAGRIQDGRVVQSFSSLTRDISLAGLGLIQGIRVDAGKELIVCLPRLKGEPVYMKVIIRHCRDLADNLYSVGTEFNGQVSAETAKMLEDLGQAERKRISDSILT